MKITRIRINKYSLRSVTCLLIAIVLTSSAIVAQEPLYYLKGSGLFQQSKGGDFFDFESAAGFGGGAGFRLGSRWEFGLDYHQFQLANDESADSTDRLAGFDNNVGVNYEINRFGLQLGHLLMQSDNRSNLMIGARAGIMIWKVVDVKGDTVVNVVSDRNATVDFEASELYLGSMIGFRWMAGRRVAFDLSLHADYLTSAGAEFATNVNDVRDKWLFGSTLSLNIFFGNKREVPDWEAVRESSGNFAQPLTLQSRAIDSDGDGVPDRVDRCRNSPRGVRVDQFGCPLDSDRDGVYDGLDDCSDTPREASGKVDIYGCPFDSDFDGIPDFQDICPKNMIGAVVDENGCPVDSDGDGVADGLDDCPNTLAGMVVDKQGCIDLEVLAKPMVLNIDYVSGAFEIDRHNQERLKRLSGLLNFVPDYKIEINGYTDNVGTAVANRRLSEKRARRVRDFLVNFDVASQRIKVFGRGEVNFIASNQTAEGRSKNRRIEIVFYR